MSPCSCIAITINGYTSSPFGKFSNAQDFAVLGKRHASEVHKSADAKVRLPTIVSGCTAHQIFSNRGQASERAPE